MSGIATAIVGSAVVGYAASNSASKRAAGAANNATAAQTQLGYEQLSLSKDELAWNKERAKGTDALAERVANAQIDTMNKQQALADDYANYNKETFRPLEQSMVNEAENYDSASRQEAEAGKAGASVKQAFQGQREATARDMARMGVNPNSGSAAETRARMGVQEALGEAGAENNARTGVQTQAWARKMDAASLGRNLPSAQATAAQIGVNAGTAAVSNTVAANQSFQNGLVAPGALMSGASSSFSQAANNYNNIVKNANQASADVMGGIGSAAGMYLRYGVKAPTPATPAPGIIF